MQILMTNAGKRHDQGQAAAAATPESNNRGFRISNWSHGADDDGRRSEDAATTAAAAAATAVLPNSVHNPAGKCIFADSKARRTC